MGNSASIKDTIDRINQITNESHEAIGQLYLALNELDISDGRGNIGLWRMEQAAKQLEWCATRIKELKECLDINHLSELVQ